MGYDVDIENEEVTMTSKAPTKPTERRMVEVMIRDTVYDAALLRAQAQAQQLRTVAREILFDRASQARPREGFAALTPTARILGQPPRTRVRFLASAKSYDKAKARLHAAGTSVTAAIEDGLEHYARTGQFK